MTWHDMTWHDMTWHDMTWQSWHTHIHEGNGVFKQRKTNPTTWVKNKSWAYDNLITEVRLRSSVNYQTNQKKTYSPTSCNTHKKKPSPISGETKCTHLVTLTVFTLCSLRFPPQSYKEWKWSQQIITFCLGTVELNPTASILLEACKTPIVQCHFYWFHPPKGWFNWVPSGQFVIPISVGELSSYVIYKSSFFSVV